MLYEVTKDSTMPIFNPPHDGICPDCGGRIVRGTTGWTCFECGKEFNKDNQISLK